MKKEKDLLEAAITELHFRAQMRFSPSQKQMINWGEVNIRLNEIKLALEENDSVSFKKNYFYLLKNLRYSNGKLREFGEEPEDPRQLAPEGTRELLNHIVDRITRKLGELTPPLQKQPRTPGTDLQKGLKRTASGEVGCPAPVARKLS